MPYTDLIRRTYRPEMAHQHVVALSQFHRIQASPGLRAAAGYVAEQLEAAGVQVAIHRYPASAATGFWACPGFQEWSCDGATLHLLDERGEVTETLCDFAAIPISLIQRSIPASGEFDVVAPAGKGGKDAADYAGLDVAGKVVLTNESVARVLELAVRERGAAGILFDGMKAGGRSDLDLPDARQYTSFWWAGGCRPDGWGFVLSPRQGRKLRSRLAEGKPVRVRAEVRSRFYDGGLEVVEAVIPGATQEEVLLVGHLCHPRPGAHDNASGAAALLEAAATLSRLIAEGRLPGPPITGGRPTRGIRFLWVPEMTGSYAWLAEHQADVERGRWIAGLNLDMVGADQNQTGSVWQLVNLPQAASAFADHLLSWLRQPFLEGQRFEDAPFSAGSDHYILSDPTVGIPTPMLLQWPDKFYHTSADTPDRVSPDSLGRSGALAATYAFWLAMAGPAEARWLGHLMVTRFAAQAAREAVAAVEAVRTAEDQPTKVKAWRHYRRRSAFLAGRMAIALGTLQRLDPHLGESVTAWRAEVAETAAREAAWAEEILGPDRPAETPPATDEQWRAEAEKLVPRRLFPGPADLGMALQSRPRELREAYWQLEDSAGRPVHDEAALLQYWADGRRTVAEIADLVELETGKPAGDLALRFFRLLAQIGLVQYE